MRWRALRGVYEETKAAAEAAEGRCDRGMIKDWCGRAIEPVDGGCCLPIEVDQVVDLIYVQPLLTWHPHCRRRSRGSDVLN